MFPDVSGSRRPGVGYPVMLPGRCATAQAIDRKEPWEQIALKAVEDGYIELADQFDGFVEVCLRDASRARQARHPKIP